MGISEDPDPLVADGVESPGVSPVEPGSPAVGGRKTPAGASRPAQPELLETDSSPFDALFAEFIARNATCSVGIVLQKLARNVLHWRGIPLATGRGALVAGLLLGTPWLMVPLVFTAAASQWQGAPVWRWLATAVMLGVWGVIAELLTRPSLAKCYAILGAITKESDLRRLYSWTQRWGRLCIAATFGIVFAGVAALALRKLAPPASVGQLPLGSAVVLVMILYQAGEMVFERVVFLPPAFFIPEFSFRLNWLDPADTPAFRTSIRGFTGNEFLTGLYDTFLMVAAIVVLGLKSPLLVPVAIVLLGADYAAILVEAVAMRIMLGRIVRTAKDTHTAEIQRRIDEFGPRFAELGDEEFARLERLKKLQDMIRGAPGGPKTMPSAMRLAATLVVPTVTFLATVIGERYAGRLFEQILP